jgi:hypothetical protein
MDPIITLAGMVDVSAFVDGSTTATASKVVAEFGQLLSKTNEIVTGITVVAADLDTAEGTLSAMSNHEARIGAIEGRSGILVELSSSTITTSVANANTAIVIGSTGVDTVVTLTAGNDEGATIGKTITIISGKATFSVYVRIAQQGQQWGNGNDYLKGFVLAPGESITLAPFTVIVSNSVKFRWAIVAGKTWANIVTM